MWKRGALWAADTIVAMDKHAAVCLNRDNVAIVWRCKGRQSRLTKCLYVKSCVNGLVFDGSEG